MENSKKVISIEDLKSIINLILTHITDDLKISHLELTEDCYWEILEKNLYAIDGDRPPNVIGSLSDDWEFLEPLLTDRDQAISLMLAHVAPLLRYIANKVGQ